MSTTTSKTIPTTPEPPATALRTHAAQWLLKAILRGELPPGDRLVLQKLAQQIGVSVTPVREAMLTLQTLGLVTVQHNCGSTVRKFGPRQLREVFQVWSILEEAAFRWACGHIDHQALLELREAMTELSNDSSSDGWSEKEMDLDHRFSELIIGSCRCERLVEEIGRYNELTSAIREVFGSRPKFQRRALREHIEIIDALLVGDPQVVESMIIRHNHLCAQSLERFFNPDEADHLAPAI